MKNIAKTENEKHLLEVLKRIRAGHNLAGGFIPYQEVCEKTQLILINELDKWETHEPRKPREWTARIYPDGTVCVESKYGLGKEEVVRLREVME
jgi:hypothetical protein